MRFKDLENVSNQRNSPLRRYTIALNFELTKIIQLTFQST